MQPLTAAPRDTFTEAQVRAVLTAPDLEVGFGCELLEGLPNLVDAESSSFGGGTVGLWQNNFFGGTACTITNSGARAAAGGKSMLITWPTTAVVRGSGPQWAVSLVIGARYTFGVQVYVPTGNPPVSLGDIFGGTPLDDSTLHDEWQQLSITFVAVKTAHFFGVLNAEPVTAGQECYVDVFGGAIGDALPSTGTAVDISADVAAGGTIHRDCLADVHGTVTLSISRALAWGRDKVKPYMTLSSPTAGVTGCRFNQGVYILTTPSTALGEDPVTYAVSGFDQVYMLQNNIGDSYSVPIGTGVLTAVQAALVLAGVTSPILIDTAAAAKTLATAMTWPLTSSENPTWLKVVNDLLKAINYQPIWCDWDGAFRSGPKVEPSERPDEWVFPVGDLRVGIVATDRSVANDTWNAPNWWRFVRNDMATVPAEGAGRYTVTNQSTGPSSIDSVGRVVRAPVQFLDAVDQGSLEDQGDAIKAEAMRVSEIITTKLSPFPLAWHLDRAMFSDPALGQDRQVQARSWDLPLDGSDMNYVIESV